MELRLSREQVEKAEQYRAGRNTLFFTVVSTEIAQYTQLGNARRPATTELHRIASEYFESHYHGCVLHTTPQEILSVFSDSVAAVLGTLYLHNRIASYPIGGAQVRLRSGIDTGSVAPPGGPGLVPPMLMRWASVASQAMQVARVNGIMATEEVVRRVCGRLTDYFGFVWPEKRQFTVDGKVQTTPVYTLEHRNLPPVMPSADAFPRAQITLYVRDAGQDSQVTFDADHHGNIFLGSLPTCNVKLASEGVAQHHTRILLDESGNWVIEDAGSETGTYLNGERVVYGAMLKPGDEIRVGHAAVWVQHMLWLGTRPELGQH